MPSLVLLRHGQTEWTREKRFAGWGDAPLSEEGIREAHKAARTLKASGLTFDRLITSCLDRAKHTARIVQAEIAIPQLELEIDWRLNERHYGALQGHLRADIVERYGQDRVFNWREVYDARPPELAEDCERLKAQFRVLPELSAALHPRGESMSDAAQRTVPIWTEQIAPTLSSGQNILIVAHTNLIRTLVGQVENFNDAQAATFRIPTATPRHYQFDEKLTPISVRDLTQNPGALYKTWSARRRINRLANS